MKVITNTDLKKWKRKTDNRMHAFGDTDLEKKVIRVNKKKSQKIGKKNDGEVLDSIIHEVSHAKHPKMHEKTVRKHTKHLLKKLNPKQKQSYRSLFS